MNENNLPNIDGEENTTPVEETTEEVVEEAAEAVAEEEVAAEEVAEEVVADDVLEVAEDVLRGTAGEVLEGEEMPVNAEQVVEIAEEMKAKGGAGKIVAIILVIVAIVAAAGFGIVKYVTRNPYNEMGYLNVSGRNVEEVAAAAGMTLEQFLAEYGLPADMPADTEEAAAFYNIPVSKIAEMYGMDLATLKGMLGLGDDVTENTPWGEAEGKSPLKSYVGEENLEEFKAEYGFGDEVTGETLWGEVRRTVDEKTLEAQQAAMEEAENAEAEAEAEAPVEAEAEEATEPVADPAAEEVPAE